MGLTFKNTTGNRDARWLGNGFGSSPSRWVAMLDGQEVATLQQSKVTNSWLVNVQGTDCGRHQSLEQAKTFVRDRLSQSTMPKPLTETQAVALALELSGRGFTAVAMPSRRGSDHWHCVVTDAM